MFGISPAPRAGGCMVILPPETRGWGLGVWPWGLQQAVPGGTHWVPKPSLPQQLPHSPEDTLKIFKSEDIF